MEKIYNSEQKKVIRNYGIDVLRIIAMFFVTMGHLVGWGGIIESAGQMSVEYEAAQMLKIISLCSINCFGFISGYVGYGKKLNVKKLFLLWIQVVFWLLVITWVMKIFFPITITREKMIKMFFPIVSQTYWYITAYFIIMFFAPVMNWLINKIGKLFIIAYVISLICVSVILTTSGNNAVWLMICYCGGALIKKYDKYIDAMPRIGIGGYMGCIMVTWGGQFLDKIGYIKFPEIVRHMWCGRCDGVWPSSLTMYFAAFFLILWAKQKQYPINWQNRIKRVAPLQLSVYLITVHPFIWEYLLKERFGSFSDKLFLILVGVPLCTVFINTFCMGLEQLRIWLWNRFILLVVNGGNN